MQPNTTDPMDQVIEILQKQGISEEQIAQLIAEVNKNGIAVFQKMAMSLMTDEDIAAIEACQDQEQANREIMTRFVQRSGKDPQQVVDEFVTNFVTGFLKAYEQDKNAAMASLPNVSNQVAQ